ncbi:unnamed protein product [Vitrella brassicaformis CCMP3155]|uniref:pyruvate, phosphate dikinase n=2 Tax=Vitrella brassicaformis TaxID=1169539 RepID=A0A0G4FGF1_VITBC|nr:unnamed protein product [Vitrella brassicaformis CCMP3155]|eukprot:CEM11909.1 unnamed protein product [Vitrella brassicaformis CCMP3155]
MRIGCLLPFAFISGAVAFVAPAARLRVRGALLPTHPRPSTTAAQSAVAEPPDTNTKETGISVGNVVNGFERYVFSFGDGCDTPPLDKNLLGGKGKGVSEMADMGLPVPPGFVITTEACKYYRNNKRAMPEGLDMQVEAAMKVLERQMNAQFGSIDNPLLVAVRSGARVSMPGMMETVLNLGLNDEAVEGFARQTNNRRLAYDSYRRFITMYSNVVEHVNPRIFEKELEKMKEEQGVTQDVDLSADALKELCQRFKALKLKATGTPFPDDPREQLVRAIRAVFDSWDSERAGAYRRFHGYPDDWGTAVVIMTMVFGNKGDDSATGVGFTRDPSTGEKRFYGEFLPNAQGEDVVAGIRTPQPVNELQAVRSGSDLPTLEKTMPEAYKQLMETAQKLETHFRDMQDLEFTIDKGRLFMLQTRTGKRTGLAAINIAFDMLNEGLIDEKELIMRIEPEQLVQLLAPVFDPQEKKRASPHLAARGLNAGPGAASGVAVFSTEKAVEMKAKGVKCVLVREETSPEDFSGMVAAEGVLTMRGGSTSHAAVVARGIGKPCVCGCGSLRYNREENFVRVEGTGMVLREGDPISIDGTTGEVYFAELHTTPSEVLQVLIDKTKLPEESKTFQQFNTIMTLADKYRRLRVHANADTGRDAEVARALGAQGIGLTRTEHMFMDKERLTDVRKMLFSETEQHRKEAVAMLLKYQKSDFVEIFRAMDGHPTTIRLLDPPRHEFMPHDEEELQQLADAMDTPLEELLRISEAIREANPMLGHRGCRLGILFPYLTEMQAQAIFEAAVEVAKEGKTVMPEVMVPLVTSKNELRHQKAIIDNTAKAAFERSGMTLPYKVGTMIELPRAALRAKEIAELAEFFSFGTNDLTQSTFGISRDDSGHFVPAYISGVEYPGEGQEKIQILDNNPFDVLDQDGVGELMEIARDRGKQSNPNLKTGICGEHGGEGRSVNFCHRIGLDYVSCSPYRVPVARLAAAQAAIEELGGGAEVAYQGPSVGYIPGKTVVS